MTDTEKSEPESIWGQLFQLGLIGSFMLVMGGVGGYFYAKADEPQVRFDERERDLKVLFTKFSECNQDPACENLYRQAYFELRADQQLRDGRDALERIYEERPYLRPQEATVE